MRPTPGSGPGTTRSPRSERSEWSSPGVTSPTTSTEKGNWSRPATPHATRYAATHALTGLPNRTLLLERITDALAHADGEDGLAVIYLDLDGFKQVNDTYGHAAGDQLLCAVATRLSNLIRAQDTVARLGGDEFVIVLRLPRSGSAADFIARARAAIERPVQVIGGAIRPRASLGVVRCPSDGHDITEIIRRADQAMYRDKAQRRQQSDPARSSGSEDLRL